MIFLNVPLEFAQKLSYRILGVPLFRKTKLPSAQRAAVRDLLAAILRDDQLGLFIHLRVLSIRPFESSHA